MARRPVSANAPVEIPRNVSVDSKGYVYLNLSYTIRTSKDGSHTYVDHSRVLIGKAVESSSGNWRDERMMYPNARYLKMLQEEKERKALEQLPEEERDSRPVPPPRSDHLFAGFWSAVKKLAEESGLTKSLKTAFGEYEADLLLDLASCMLASGREDPDLFHHWARHHATFLDSIPDDLDVSTALPERISRFYRIWAQKAAGSGERLLFCYDCPEEGNSPVGYVLRERDGLPVAFTGFTGSVRTYVEDLLGSDEPKASRRSASFTLVCDEEMVSREDITFLDEAGVDFLLRLSPEQEAADTLLCENVDSLPSPQGGMAALTLDGPLFEGDEKIRHFHLIRDCALEAGAMESFYRDIEIWEKDLKKAIERKERLTADEFVNRYGDFFTLVLQSAGTLEPQSPEMRPVFCYRIIEGTRDQEYITAAKNRLGCMVFVASREMTAREVFEIFRRKDRRKEVFPRRCRPSLVMAGFSACVIRVLLEEKTRAFREENHISTDEVIKLLEEISCDKNPGTGHYERRYRLTDKQNGLIQALGISLCDMDALIDAFDRFN